MRLDLYVVSDCVHDIGALTFEIGPQDYRTARVYPKH
jgi:hypothetical protein